jgi:hypothetical protein
MATASVATAEGVISSLQYDVNLSESMHGNLQRTTSQTLHFNLPIGSLTSNNAATACMSTASTCGATNEWGGS